MHLIKLQLSVNRRLHLYSLLTVAGVMFAGMMYFVFAKPFGLVWDIQEQIASVGVMLFMLMASGYYWRLDRTSARLQALMLPVSVTERLVAAFVIIFVLYQVAYLLIFFVCNSISFFIGNYLLHQGNRYFYILDGDRFYWLFMVGFVMTSFGLAGGLTFRNLPVVKTVAIVALIIIIVNSGIGLLARSFVENEPQRQYILPFNGEEITVKYQFFRAGFDDWTVRPVTTSGDVLGLETVNRPAWLSVMSDVVIYALPFLLICLAWQKLRESTL